MMKNVIFSIVLLLVFGLTIEAGSALVLFYSGQLTGRPMARFDYSEGRLATEVLVHKVMGRFVLSDNLDITSDPPRIYVPHPKLGYDFIPGKAVYLTKLRRTGKVHVAPFNILETGGRATGYLPNPRERKIWVFGDSVIFGGGNPDEHSFPWLLQARFPDFEVKNLATPGHGNVQSLLRLQERVGKVGPDDILIWGYGDYLNHRNTVSPSLVNVYDADMFEKLFPEGLRLPLARLENGTLKIDMFRMSCEGQEAWCEAGDPSFEEQTKVTSALLEAFVGVTQAVTVVAYVEGPDDDPVIARARQLGLIVADLRPDPMRNESDDFYPFDTHPGALTHFHYFRKLAAVLLENGLVSLPAGAE
ncbi:MAG TPA: SGNH/GDSL hydrolase family protein [Gammaproteobacteria bacterium]|nr:SGNH/GDSL hydrolase family protein [Gammaproteobacteria bacterium]